MSTIHRQGGPGPVFEKINPEGLYSMIGSSQASYLYAGHRNNRGPWNDVCGTFLYKHEALLESRIRFIQEGS